MSIWKNSIKYALLAAIGTCALTGCGKIDPTSGESLSAVPSPSASAAATEPPSTESAAATEPPSTESAAATSSPAETTAAPAETQQEVTPFSQHGTLHVDGAQLVDQNGEPFQLYGMSSHGIAWFPQYINYDAFRTLRDDWNTNCIRLAMYTAESGGYCTDGNQEELKALVRNGVDYATALGMYVIVDWHILSDNDPNQNKDAAIAFFREMSAEFADHDNVLYEICNEPNGSTSWDSIKSYAQEVIPVIREQKENAVILVGTPTWSQEIDKAAASPLEYDNILYTLHFYAATHKDELRSRLETCAENGLPVFVSEFGMCDASGNGANDFEQTTKWLELLDRYQISFCCWNLANKAESSSVFRTDSTRLSDWTEEDFNESGKWIRDYFRSRKES